MPDPSATLIGAMQFSASTASLDVTSVTVAAGQVLLVPIIYVQGLSNPASVAWDPAGVNEALTLLKRQREDGATGIAVDWWVRLNPTPGAAKTITVTNGDVIQCAAAAVGIADANTGSLAAFVRDTTLTGGTADSNGTASDPATVTVADVISGDLVLDVLVAQTSANPDTGQIALIDNITSGQQFGVSWKAGVLGGVMSWLKEGGGTQQWAIAAMAIKAVAAAAGPLPFRTSSVARLVGPG